MLVVSEMQLVSSIFHSFDSKHLRRRSAQQWSSTMPKAQPTSPQTYSSSVLHPQPVHLPPTSIHKVIEENPHLSSNDQPNNPSRNSQQQQPHQFTHHSPATVSAYDYVFRILIFTTTTLYSIIYSPLFFTFTKWFKSK